ncbi:hypothetical protein [Amycolatopsis methanolica]|nr:hypothetical protein [Amycolatopsis methanolica]
MSGRRAAGSSPPEGVALAPGGVGERPAQPGREQLVLPGPDLRVR